MPTPGVSLDCVACAVDQGMTTSGEGSTSCDACLSGRYYDEGGCHECPSSVNCSSGYQDLSSLWLEPGYWRIGESGPALHRQAATATSRIPAPGVFDQGGRAHRRFYWR